MSSILEEDNSDVDIDLTSVRHAKDSFMILSDCIDDASPLDDTVAPSEESQSESSDSSYLNIGLGSDIDDEEIDSTTASMDLDEQGNQELDEVSSGIPTVTLKLRS